MNKIQRLPAVLRGPRRTPPVRVRIKKIQGNVPTFGSPGPRDEVWQKKLQQAFGSVSDDFLQAAFFHLTFAACLPGQGPSEIALNAAISIVAAASPKNEVEAALVLQDATLHMVSMALLARIGGGHFGPHRLPALASATAKLIKAGCATVETLRRLRGNGDQKITVQHQYVTLNNQGGQAILGSAVNSRTR